MERGDDIYLSKLSIGWGDEVSDGRTCMPPTSVSISAVVGQGGVRALYVRGREVDKDKCIALSGCPISPDAVNAKNNTLIIFLSFRVLIQQLERDKSSGVPQCVLLVT